MSELDGSAPKTCPLCDGRGMRVVVKEGGGRLAEPCECVHERKLYLLLRKAKIPARYEACTFENYKPSGELFLAYKSITNSYNPSVEATELEILQPVFDAEVLVIDELGAAKMSEWVAETVALILNTRYNDKRTTILTTNYPDLPAGESSPGARSLPGAVREETLGDRIGERMRSRLQEMCVHVEMRGPDYRRETKRARFV